MACNYRGVEYPRVLSEDERQIVDGVLAREDRRSRTQRMIRRYGYVNVEMQILELDRLMATGVKLTEAECRERFPELIAYIKSKVSLLSVLRSYGVKLEPQ